MILGLTCLENKDSTGKKGKGKRGEISRFLFVLSFGTKMLNECIQNYQLKTHPDTHNNEIHHTKQMLGWLEKCKSTSRQRRGALEQGTLFQVHWFRSRTAFPSHDLVPPCVNVEASVCKQCL